MLPITICVMPVYLMCRRSRICVHTRDLTSPGFSKPINSIAPDSFLYPHPPCNLRCQTFSYQPQTALFTKDREKITTLWYHAQFSLVLSLSFPTALCVLFMKLPHIRYIPRPLMPFEFYKLRILHYAIKPPPPSPKKCRVFREHTIFFTIHYETPANNATNKQTKQAT
jgi:hypothetical protein